MLFNSLAFLVFAPVFYILYFSLRGRARLVWCIGASYFFYAWWDWRFVGLIFGSTLVAFYSGRMIGASSSEGGRKFWLWFCVVTHLGALFFFKYFNFLAGSLKSLFHWLGYDLHYENPGILLPVGISFFTFTALSYTIDVYRKKICPAEPSFIVFATYECLFPHLVAGPILRASQFLPQLKKDHPFDWAQAGRGLEMIGWGYVLKMCLADNAALFADQRFAQPELFTSASLILAVLAFAFQIYGDFAGYSLIAIGLARIMGYDFGINFNKPYFASNFSEFWQRWHISLSSWIRDYLYIPLGGSKKGPARTVLNLVITMFLAGLWHGAGWNYVLWGLLHGLYLAGQRLVSKHYDTCCRVARLPAWVSKLIAIATVFTLTCLGWVFFRARSLESGFYMLKAIFSWNATAHLSFGGMRYQLLRVFVLVCIVLVVDLVSSKERLRAVHQGNAYVRAATSGFALLLILFAGSFAANSFIYFQF
jgi:alginate O-acetyltransferase complex protein AlgI